jgi:ribosomal subunit interface protein
MHTTITALHCEISEELRQRAQAVLERLASHAMRPVDGTVVFDNGPGPLTAEIRLHIAKGDVFVATGEAVDHRSALDRAEEKLRRQLEKTPTPSRGGRRSQPDRA